jgi:hypothetical protein
MEPSGRNRWQPVANGTHSKTLKQADPQPVATRGNRFGAHGKEGVDGSSPSEGLQKRRTSAPSRMCSVGVGAPEGLDGAVYGAFASKNACDVRC